ncbi:hypothetical protein [Actinoplanes sp. NPDC051851]|uniref:hypothetical protein n=1 Tax=Actinoplanes sp. NPDC051851 TaxID=3154753 RepID=UPI00342411C4
MTSRPCRACGRPLIEVARTDITTFGDLAQGLRRYTWGRYAACEGCGSTAGPELPVNQTWTEPA